MSVKALAVAYNEYLFNSDDRLRLRDASVKRYLDVVTVYACIYISIAFVNRFVGIFYYDRTATVEELSICSRRTH